VLLLQLLLLGLLLYVLAWLLPAVLRLALLLE
jgi:hypothetical protein